MDENYLCLEQVIDDKISYDKNNYLIGHFKSVDLEKFVSVGFRLIFQDCSGHAPCEVKFIYIRFAQTLMT